MKQLFRTILLIVSLLLVSCVKEEEIISTQTGNTDWNPIINLTANNYNRIRFTVSPEPSKEIHRNLERIIVQVRRFNESEFLSFDTISVIRFFLNQYISPDSFISGETYYVRVIAEFWNGVKQISNEISFVPPVVKGKIEKQIPLPFSQLPYIENFGFYNGKLYIIGYNNHNAHWGWIDTANQLYQPVNIVLRDTFLVGIRDYNNFEINNDTIIFYEYSFSRLHFSFYRFSDLTKIQSSLIYLNDSVTHVHLKYLNGTLTVFSWFNNNKMDITKYALQTMDTLEHHSFTQNSIENPVFIGDELWGTFYRDFDTRVVKFNIQTGGIIEEHRNPVLYSHQLRWDGTNFWVRDLEKNYFNKISLNGL